VLYHFPPENIVDFFVIDDDIWLGSENGIIHVDRKTGKRTDYISYPIYRKDFWASARINGMVETEDRIYYSIRPYGMYAIDKKTRNIMSVTEVNDYCINNDLRICDIYYKGNLIYIAANQMKPFSHYMGSGNASLLVFNKKTGSLKAYDTGVKYYDEFIDLGVDIIGYGEYIEASEGGAGKHYGGAFMFSKKDETINIMTKLPVVKIYEDRGLAAKAAEYGGEGYVRMYDLKYMEAENAYAVEDRENEETNYREVRKEYETLSKSRSKPHFEKLKDIKVKQSTWAVQSMDSE
jgi:hypothetical protein